MASHNSSSAVAAVRYPQPCEQRTETAHIIPADKTDLNTGIPANVSRMALHFSTILAIGVAPSKENYLQNFYGNQSTCRVSMLNLLPSATLTVFCDDGMGGSRHERVLFSDCGDDIGRRLRPGPHLQLVLVV